MTDLEWLAIRASLKAMGATIEEQREVYAMCKKQVITKNQWINYVNKWVNGLPMYESGGDMPRDLEDKRRREFERQGQSEAIEGNQSTPASAPAPVLEKDQAGRIIKQRSLLG